MIYSKTIRAACSIMYAAHKNDTDKGGYPYVFHPFYLASQMDDETGVCAALLHDVIEDHGDRFSFDDFRNAGIPEASVNAVQLLTHDPSVPYEDYIRMIGTDPIARKVKIADLKHNLDASRNDGIPSPKHEIYLKALKYLESI